MPNKNKKILKISILLKVKGNLIFLFTTMIKVVNNISKYSFTQHFLDNIVENNSKRPSIKQLVESSVEPIVKPVVELIVEPVVVRPPALIKKIVKNEFFSPRQKDNLFWCLYIIKHGFAAYDMLGDKYFSNEKIEKFNYIELLRKNKAMLKENKIKPLSEIEDNIANSACISIKTLSALALLENINIVIVFKKTYCEFINNAENQTHIIHKIGDKYKYELDPIVHTYKDYLKIASFENPLMPISSYKISELVELCIKIGIADIKQSKSNLYQSIITNLKN